MLIGVVAFMAFALAINWIAVGVSAAAQISLAGYAWSDNIGWIDVGHSVKLDDTTGEFSGYAWSDNAGWISFNPADIGTSCPVQVDGSCKPRMGGNSMAGWARACSIFVSGCSGSLKPLFKTGGWDGWISLSGVSLQSDNRTFGGCAWGSEVVGYACFEGVALASVFTPLEEVPPPPPNLPQVDLRISSQNTNPDGSVNARLSWTTQNTAQCAGSESPASPATSFTGAQSLSGTNFPVNNIGATKDFILTCTDLINSVFDRVTITVLSALPSPAASFDLSAIPNLMSISFVSNKPETTTKTRVKLSPQNGFSSDTVISVGGIYQGGTMLSVMPTANFTPINTLSPGTYSSGIELKVTIPRRITAGTYSLRIIGTGGGLTRTVDVPLKVLTHRPGFTDCPPSDPECAP